MKQTYLYKLFLLNIFLLPFTVNGQITFETTFPTTKHESGRDVLQTSDGGFMIAASNETNLTNDRDIMIFRTDNLGNFLWKKSYGGNLPEYPSGMLKAADGNYFIVGYSQSFGGGDYDHYLLKVNSAGDSLMEKVYGGWGNEELKEIIATADGNYVMVGASNSVTSSLSNNNIQLIKIDIDGNVIWSKNYGDASYESARSVKLCADGGFVILGKRVNPSGNSSMFLIKTNSVGDSLWSQIYSGPASLEGKFVVVNADGSYTMAVDDSSAISDSDVRIMKVDPTGNVVLWNKLYSGTDKDITKMIQTTSDGGYIVTAMSRSFGWNNPDYWILKLNSLGDTVWAKNFGGSDHEHCYVVRQTSDGGYIVVGHSRSNPIRTEEIYLIKLNSNGEFGPVGVGVNSLLANNDVTVYPNPAQGMVTIDITSMYEPESYCMINNALGQLIYTHKVDPANLLNTIDMKGNSPGVYYITVRSNNHSVTKKLILN